MLTCKRCRSEMNENNRFCTQCGKSLDSKADAAPDTGLDSAMPVSDRATYCGKCGAKLPEDCEYCLICGVKAGEAPPFEFESVALDSEQHTAEIPVSHRHSKRMTKFCVAICAALILSAASVWLAEALPRLNPAGKNRAKDSIIYLDSQNTLKFISTSMESPETLTSNYTGGNHVAKASPDGRYIAYLNGGSLNGSNAKLILHDFGKATITESPQNTGAVISDSAAPVFFFTEDGSALIYLDFESGMYVCNLREPRLTSKLLDTGVDSIISYKSNQILYTKPPEEEGGPDSVCVYSLDSGSAVSVKEVGLSVLDYTPSFDRVIFMSSESEKGGNVLAYDSKLNTVRTLAVGVGSVIDADAKTFTVLYQTETANSLRYENIVNDDLARADDNIQAPDLNDYPLLKEFFDENNFNADDTEDAEKENPEDSEDLAEQRGKFYDEIDKYDAKLDNDKLRASLKKEIDGFAEKHPILYDLHLCRDGVTTRLAEGNYAPFDTAELDALKGFVIWSCYNFESSSKITFSEYAASAAQHPLSEILNSGMKENLYLQQFGYVPTSVTPGDTYSFDYQDGWQLTEKSDGFYFIAADKGADGTNTSALYYAPIQNGSVGNISLIDEHVSGIGGMLSGDRLIYYKDMTDAGSRNIPLGNVYILTNGVAQKIGDNIALSEDYLKTENADKTLLYCEHFNTSSKSGTLFMLTKQSRQLATEVHSIYYRNDYSVYFLRKLESGKTALYSFGNNGLVQVEENVRLVMQD